MSNLLSSIFFCLFLFVSNCLATSIPKNIFILAGQSNMAGRGGVEKNPNDPNNTVWDRHIPLESQPSSSILRLNPYDQWEEAREPLHQGIDINKTVGIVPGMPFAHQLLNKVGLKAGAIGLVSIGRAGILIKKWMKDPNNSNTTLYNQLISRIKASYLQGGTVRALFWYQGESDASNDYTAIPYKDNVKKFFVDIRNDVKPIFLPIIMIKIASFDTYIPHESPSLNIVRMAQDAVHRELPDVQIIDALQLVKSGVGFNKDHVHLNVNSQITLGEWLADTYLSYYGKFL